MANSFMCVTMLLKHMHVYVLIQLSEFLIVFITNAGVTIKKKTNYWTKYKNIHL